MSESENKYEKGNEELLTMFKSKSIDREAAEQIVAGIADLNRPILDLDGHSTTYLYEAETYNNIDAVRFLLEHGADPNLCMLDLVNDCPLYDLHFLWEEMEDDAKSRLDIAKLFFEYGADPDLWYEYETLYDHVVWEVFNDWLTPHDWSYISRFFLILIAYGGGNGKSYYKKANLSEPIDRSRIDEYELKLFKCEDGYHLEGHLFNPEGMDIGTV